VKESIKVEPIRPSQTLNSYFDAQNHDYHIIV
jgi:hypothetical protein